ncbi:skin secretory protein xP2 isoform X4 [Cylas formicarius]|uniref:skin secretory protein xP2 isoform X4 n=1 Tax=Cylas formicarius TaxID=197179 RepID=UPI0029584741|nr:skin secretory protein xP2 isoform X4 [Cylas formicarius]
MADDEKKKLEEEKKRKQAEIERKRAEVRARMEEASKAKKAKKGFMTPERKKKLRLLLRKKAAEELKKEQERKAAERRRIIEERCGKPKLIDDANEEQLKSILKQYYGRIGGLEDAKWELEHQVKKKDYEIADLNSQVNDLRGKFVKPTLKKVSKYENKFAKLQKKAAEFNFRNQLKVVKKKEFTLEEEDKEKKPDWSKKGEKEEDAAKPAEEAAVPAEGQPPVEGQPSVEGQPESQPEGQQVAEGQPPTEGDGGAAVEGQTPAEGPPAESVAPIEAETNVEGEAKPQEEAPPGPFETFKQLVISENYDFVALPEAVLAPTDDVEAVKIPNYSLIENRKNSGEGVVLYIKDSLKFKVVDLTSENPETQVTFESLIEKLKSQAVQPAEGTAAETTEVAAAAPAEGVPEGAEVPAEAAAKPEGAEGQPAKPAETPAEGGAEAPPPEAATAEMTQVPEGDAAPAQTEEVQVLVAEAVGVVAEGANESVASDAEAVAFEQPIASPPMIAAA